MLIWESVRKQLEQLWKQFSLWFCLKTEEKKPIKCIDFFKKGNCGGNSPLPQYVRLINNDCLQYLLQRLNVCAVNAPVKRRLVLPSNMQIQLQQVSPLHSSVPTEPRLHFLAHLLHFSLLTAVFQQPSSSSSPLQSCPLGLPANC